MTVHRNWDVIMCSLTTYQWNCVYNCYLVLHLLYLELCNWNSMGSYLILNFSNCIELALLWNIFSVITWNWASDCVHMLQLIL